MMLMNVLMGLKLLINLQHLTWSPAIHAPRHATRETFTMETVAHDTNVGQPHHTWTRTTISPVRDC